MKMGGLFALYQGEMTVLVCIWNYHLPLRRILLRSTTKQNHSMQYLGSTEQLNWHGNMRLFQEEPNFICTAVGLLFVQLRDTPRWTWLWSSWSSGSETLPFLSPDPITRHFRYTTIQKCLSNSILVRREKRCPEWCLIIQPTWIFACEFPCGGWICMYDILDNIPRYCFCDSIVRLWTYMTRKLHIWKCRTCIGHKGGKSRTMIQKQMEISP